jgi:hypothetical protein
MKSEFKYTTYPNDSSQLYYTIFSRLLTDVKQITERTDDEKLNSEIKFAIQNVQGAKVRLLKKMWFNYFGTYVLMLGLFIEWNIHTRTGI